MATTKFVVCSPRCLSIQFPFPALYKKAARGLVTIAVAVAMGGLADAQQPFTCISAAAVPPLIRAEGIAELTGDLVLRCSGGVPTASNASVPQLNIQIFLNANITSRLLNDPFSEALLLIDEPAPANQRACTLGPCSISGTGAPGGVNYSASSFIANVYQGRQAGANSIVWGGIPVDPPGPNATRTIRITNIRANASQLGVSTSLAPTQVLMYVSVSGNSVLPIGNPQQTVGFIRPGLSFNLLSTDQNGNVVTPPAVSAIPLPPCASSQVVVVRFQEGFASAFNPRGLGGYFGPDSSSPPTAQAVPGAEYFSETGFYNPAFPAVNNLNRAGLADQGTRLMARFTNIPAGTSLSADLYERNVFPSRARLIATDSNGAGPFTPSDSGQLTSVNGTAIAVWEVLLSDPRALETLDFGITISYSAGTSRGTAGASGSFAPLSSVFTASSSAAVPRFVPGVVNDAFTISACRSSILFPFVSNRGGFDTGLVIANTTLDPFGSSQQSGNCNLYFYGNTSSGPVNPPVQTSGTISPGGQLIWTLGGGGNLGILPTPGFQGYVIAACGFPLVHGYAQIGAGGLSDASKGTVGYLGIVLDAPLPPASNRTQQNGEGQAH
jgi:hypothetical protein